MLITAVQSPTTTALPTAKEESDGFWREMLSGELFEVGLRLTPDKIHDSVEAAKSVGGALKGAWKDLEGHIRNVLSLPEVGERISPETRQRLTDTVVDVATYVGYTAAGIQGLAGLYKIVSGRKQGELARVLEGSLDLATSAVIATTIAGVPGVPLVLGPLAAVLGVTRGGYNALVGYRKGDSRHEIQGFLDSTRSLGIFFRLLGSLSPALATTGAILGPIAGAVQLSRGYYDLTTGIKEGSKKKQVQGLADVGTAVGLTMSLTGLGTIPGVALVAVSTGAKVLYQFNDRFQAWSDRRLDTLRPGLEKVTAKVDAAVEPLLEKVRPLIARWTGVERGSEQDEAPPTSPDPPSA